ncbi:MAG: M24 family metallopeptidase, partial [Alphaproteobacteria bacterium]
EGLRDIGILDGEINELIETKKYSDFYMHRAGHWLGMDVHDVGNYKINEEWRVLQPGMVATVEPGIYISPDNKDVDKRWRGIGIRIEDDILVTDNAPKV